MSDPQQDIRVDPGGDTRRAGSNSTLKCPGSDSKFLGHKNADTHMGKGQPKDAKPKITQILEL